MAFNFISSNKKLSQLIAQSWLDGERLEINKDWLIKQGFISEAEAPYYDAEMIEVDEVPHAEADPGNPDGPKYIGTINLTDKGKLKKYIPYPKRSDVEKLTELTDEVLEEWVNSDPNSAPWLPPNPYIPYTC